MQNMVKLLNLLLQNKSVECKSQTPSPDPKDLWVLLNIFSFRISITEHCHEATNLVFPRGFSSNMIYNVWAVFGGIMM